MRTKTGGQKRETLAFNELTAYWEGRLLAPKERISSTAERFKSISMWQRYTSL